MDAPSYSGPIDYLVFSFPRGSSPGAGLARLLEAVDRGQIEVLDLECVGTDGAGGATRVPLAEVVGVGELDLSVFDGIESDILDSADLEAIAQELEPGSFAIALVYLEHSLDETALAWVAAGGVPLLEGGVDVDDLAAALDATASNPEGES